MSSRALRKALREKEERERLPQLAKETQALEGKEDDEAEDTRDDSAPAAAPQSSIFAILQNDVGGEEEEDDEDDNAAEEQAEENDEEDARNSTPRDGPVGSTTVVRNQKKKKQQRRKRGKRPGDGGVSVKGILVREKHTNKADELDEIDTALKQLAPHGRRKSNDGRFAAADVHQAVDESCRLLAIDTAYLHAENEMRRLFGRLAIEPDQDQDAAVGGGIGGTRRQQRRQQVGLRDALRGQRQDGRSGGLTAMALRRNIFIQGKEEWPGATGGGLGMEVVSKHEDGTVLYRFAHNTAYKDVQSQFASCVESMDPNRMIVLLQHNPYHISTLLQVSEIAKQERDFTTAGDLLERALFSFGRAVHSTFSKNVQQGKARLEFRKADREFWLASWRYVQNLAMRAMWRTVYEWSKMLLSLSPQEDPYALWLVLDQYALRSRQDLDFLNISRNATLASAHKHMPHVQISQGLAEIRAGNKGRGQQCLFSAIGKYPWMVARLLQELNVDAPPAVWGKEPGSLQEKLYAELYATRAKDLWSSPEMSHMLLELASAASAETPMAVTDTSDISQNVARHVLLSDIPALIALLPREFTSRLGSASDPLPPDDAFPSPLPLELEAGQQSLGPHHIHRIMQEASNFRGQLPTGPDELVHPFASEDHRDLHSLHAWFCDLFPWYNRFQQDPAIPRSGVDDNDYADADADTGTDDAAHRHALPSSAREMMQQVQDEGVDPEQFRGRATRLIELQDRVAGESGGQTVGDDNIFHRLTVEPRALTSTFDDRGLHAWLARRGLVLDWPDQVRVAPDRGGGEGDRD